MNNETIPKSIAKKISARKAEQGIPEDTEDKKKKKHKDKPTVDVRHNFEIIFWIFRSRKNTKINLLLSRK